MRSVLLAKALGNWSGRFPEAGRLWSPAHSMHPALQSSTRPRLLQQQPPASQDRHSRISARAGHLQSQHMRLWLPQGTMLQESSPWPCWNAGPTRALCSALSPGQLTALTARRADGLAGGQGSRTKDSHGFLLVPRHKACLTSIPTQHGPSAGRLCPAAVQGGDRQDVNLPCPCLCCTKLQHPPNQLQHPQISSSTLKSAPAPPKWAPAGTGVPSSSPSTAHRRQSSHTGLSQAVG